MIAPGQDLEMESVNGVREVVTRRQPRACERALEMIRKNGRHEETRTPDLYRVKKEVTNLKPFACFAFPKFLASKTPPNRLVLVTSW